MAMTLADRWWILAVRGVAAILFGALTFIAPGLSLWALVTLFGVYAFVDGLFNLVLGLRAAGVGVRPWGSLIFEGIISLVTAGVAFLWPAITALVLLLVIATWAVITGIAEIVAAIRLRRQLQREWLLGLAGATSVAFGILLFLFPTAGALGMLLWIGAYALVFGALMVGLAFRLRAWSRASQPHAPGAGVSAPA